MRSKKEILKGSRRRHSRRRTRWLFAGAFVALLFLIGVGFVLNYHKLLIAGVRVEGAGVLKSDDIVSLAQSNIEGRWLWVLPKKSILLYPHDNLVASLASSFPRIKDLTVHLEGQTLLVKLDERKPAYLWCSDDRSSCKFMDENGFIFDEAPQFSDNVYFEFYGSVPAPSEFTKLTNFKDKFSWATPTKMKIKDDGDIDMYVKEGWKIMFNKNQSLDNLLIILGSAFSDPNLKLQTSNLQYVDLRFGRKIFYK